MHVIAKHCLAGCIIKVLFNYLLVACGASPLRPGSGLLVDVSISCVVDAVHSPA